MKYLKYFFAGMLLLLFFTQCQKEEPPVNKTPLEELARDEFYKLMKDWYLWYDKMPQVTLSDYSSPEELLEALRYKKLDKWSYISTLEEFTSYFEEGTYEGHGFGYTFDDYGVAWITFVFKDSDLYPQGVRRGWRIKQINNSDVQPFTSITPLMNGNTAGTVDQFLFLKPDSTTVTISSTRKLIHMNTVLESDTLHVGSEIVGHLVFKSFLKPSLNELDSVFSFFKSAGVNELILDMRYNTGGRMDVAAKLASLIAGTSSAEKVFIKYVHNDKQTDNNSDVLFSSEANALSLTRVVIIASKGTASASEAVLNGLKPYMTVVQIGDSTYGKPVGMHVWSYADTYAFVPVSFKIMNANDEGGFYGGIPADSYIMDGLAWQFSDRNELELKEAIKYIETGVLTSPAPSKSLRIKPYKKFDLHWMIDAY